MNIMKPLYDLTNENYPPHHRLGIVLWIGAGFGIFSLLCGIYLGYLDVRAARILKREAGSTGEKIQLRDIKDFPLTLWLIFIRLGKPSILLLDELQKYLPKVISKPMTQKILLNQRTYQMLLIISSLTLGQS